MLDTLYAQIGGVVVVLCCLFAFLKGEDLERFGAGAILLGWFASILVQQDGELYEPQIGLFVLDTIMAIIFAGMAWRSRAVWPVWAAAFQLLSVMSHIMNMIDLRTPTASLYTVLNLAGYGVLACIVVGTVVAWQERKAAGFE